MAYDLRLRAYNKQGFSMLEVIISLGIMTVGMMGIFSLIMQNHLVYNTNKNKFIAVELAQEGVELVRNYRDSNWLEGEAWDNEVENDGDYIIDAYSILDDSVDDIADARLYLDEDRKYVHTIVGNDPTPFYRLIQVTKEEPDAVVCPAGSCLKVRSWVEWNERGTNYDYYVDVLMYKWQ
ncbi:MAG: prepilin-type N-terminal cleavage/methylation domain-containing protein [Patescibacteria group bacterium]|jgi:prepilin-type N-terminal cleavage/methylation domain-containing protein